MNQNLKEVLKLADKLSHAIAKLFPMLEEKELYELAEDIKKEGLKKPIVMYQGKILDGRNRYVACKLVEAKDMRTEDYKGDDPLKYVISENLHRRHLTETQRALVAAGITEFKAGRPPKDGTEKVTQDEVAKVMNVTCKAITQGTVIRTEGTSKLKQTVARKDIPLSVAVEVARKNPKVQNKFVAEVENGTKPVDAYRKVTATPKPIVYKLTIIPGDKPTYNLSPQGSKSEFIKAVQNWHAYIKAK